MPRFLAVLLLALSPVAFSAEVPLTPTPPLAPSAADALDGVASDGHGFFVLFHNPTVLRGLQLFRGWTLDGTESTFDEAEAAAVAGSDNGYLVVMARNSGLIARRVSSSGVVLDATPIVIGPLYSGGVMTPPPAAVAWDGTRYVVVWNDRAMRRLVVSFVDRNGVVSGGDTIATDFFVASDESATVAARNGVAVVLWRQRGAVFARTIAGASIGEPFPVAFVTGAPPQIAGGGDGFLATWSLNGSIVAEHFDSNGQPGSSFQVPLSGDRPRVAWDGSAYVIIATQATTLRGIRVSATAPVGAAFDIAGGASGGDMASNGRRTLVVYGAAGLYAKFLDDLGTPFPIHGHPASQFDVHAAFDGVDDVVGFRQELPGGGSEIRLARVTTRGEPLDGAGIVVASGTVDLNDVAGGGGTSVVVWSEPNKLLAQRFTASGTPLDPAPLLISTDCLLGPARVVWDGSTFVLFWASCAGGTWAARIGSSMTPVMIHPTAFAFMEVARGANGFLIASGLEAIAVTDDLRLLAGPRRFGAPGEGLLGTASLASDGGSFLAVWLDGSNQIVAQSISANAEPLGPHIVVAATTDRLGTPRVRWEGAWWSATWPQIVDPQTSVFASARITPGGVPLTPVYVGRAPLLLLPTLLYDWSEAGARLVYSRFDRPPAAAASQRIFLQQEQPARRRAAGR
jgi:hypothetical protein